MFNPQFWWVNKSALRGPTTCSNPVGIMDCGGLGIKANNKDNIYQSWMRSRYKQGNSQGNSFPVRSNMWIGVSGHSFIHSFIDQLTSEITISSNCIHFSTLLWRKSWETWKTYSSYGDHSSRLWSFLCYIKC